jgi:glutaminase
MRETEFKEVFQAQIAQFFNPNKQHFSRLSPTQKWVKSRESGVPFEEFPSIVLDSLDRDKNHQQPMINSGAFSLKLLQASPDKPQPR